MLFENQLCLPQIWFLWAGLCPQVCSKDHRCSIGFLTLFITLSISRLLVQIPLRSLQGVLKFKIIQNSATTALRGLTLDLH
jgi:threonine/homoserine/homoserine lactone efflux protein